MAKTSESPSFELVLQVRDMSGNPTGKTKNVLTDDPAELESFLVRSCGDVFKEKRGGKNRSEENRKQSKKQDIASFIISKLEKNTRLPKNWDGKDGIPLNYNTFTSASTIIKSIADLFPYKPRVIAMPNGQAKLEFLSNKTERVLEITFFDEYSLEYFYYDPKNNFEEERSIGNNEINKLRDIFMIFNKNPK